MAPTVLRSLAARWFGDESAQSHAFRAGQVDVLIRGTPTMALGNLFNSGVVAAVVYPVVDPLLLGGWLALIWGATGYRTWRWWRGRGRSRRSAVRRRTLIRAVVWSAVAGVPWGAAGLAAVPLLPESHHLLLAFVIGGQAAAATTWWAPLLPGYLAYALASLLPLIAGFALVGSRLGYAMAAMLTAYTAVQVHFALQGNRAFRERITTLLERDSLLASLRTSYDALERQVQERTAELRESRDRLLTIADNLPAAIVHLDLEQRILFANQTLARWYGVPRERLINAISRDVVGAEAWNSLAAPRKRVLAGERATFESERTYPNGQRRHVETTFVPEFAEDGTVRGYYVLSVDRTEMHEAENTRHRLSHLLQKVIDTVPQAIYVKNRDGAYRMVNRAYAAIFGRQPEELAGRRLDELGVLPEPVAARLLEMDRAVWEQGETMVHEESRIVDHAGNHQVHRIQKLPLIELDGEITGLVGTSEDVTERVRMQAELRENEARMRALLTALPDMIFVLAADGRILDTHANEDRGDYAAAEIFLGQPVGVVLPPAAAAAIRGTLERALAADQAQTVEYRLALPDGERTFEAHMAPQGRERVVAVVRDITERRKAEEALRNSESRLRAVLDNSPASIIFKDVEGRYLFVNRRFEEWFGVSAQQAQGGQAQQFFPPDVARRLEAQEREAMRTRQPVIRELVLHTAAQREMTVLIIKFPIIDGAGEVIGVGTIATDISERKQVEDQLRQAQKMEAIGQLAGGVAHDFNNLLQIISGYTRLARSRVALPPESDQDLHQVQQASQRAADLVRNLLGFSRQQKLRKHDLDLGALIAEQTEVIRRLIGEHIHTRFRNTADETIVHADPGGIEQVLLNLCINARDAMDGGGALTIELQPFNADQAFCARNPWAAPRAYARVDVTDTGMGIPAELQQRIFEPFVTTKDVGEGSGLGLSVATGILEQHEGHLSVRSAPGAGATFSIYLPLVTAQPVEPETAEEAPPPGGNETILIAEDDDGVRNLTVMALQAQGYRVLAGSNGREALRIFTERAGEIDLAILDVVMPRMGGREVYEALRRLRPRLPVLFCTGYDAGRLDTEVLVDPLVDLIEKPYQSERLFREVRRLLDAAAAERAAFTSV